MVVIDLTLLQRLFNKKRNITRQNASDFEPSTLPRHVACIMDGNGRWAKEKGKPRAAGHREGMERVKDIVRFSSDIGIEVLTLYAFSTENWKRPKAEVGFLMNLLVEYLRAELDELHKEKVKLLTLGDISRLPEAALKEIVVAKEKTKDNTGMILNIALNYGSRLEIAMAAKELAAEVKEGKISLSDIDEQAISDRLYTNGQPDPDLVIRTSGEQRISNFLLYQVAYAEFVFVDGYWPDFNNYKYREALEIYQSRKRRFGGL
jgi:undecaprenyl diphosphate synthase